VHRHERLVREAAAGQPDVREQRAEVGEDAVQHTFPSHTRCTQYIRESSTILPWRTRRRPRTATTSPRDQIPRRIESTAMPSAIVSST
jgi:hypothetical protein